MYYHFYVISLIILFPFIYNGLRKLISLNFKRHQLQNKKIQEIIEPFIRKALQEYHFVDYQPSEYTEIDIKELEEHKYKIKVELFIINNYKKLRWNPIERLIKIHGYKIKNDFVIEKVEDKNSRDLGSIIPNNSNIPQNILFRNRRWENHKKFYNLYKKDWDIKYSDLSI
jgi:hypothetical protein